MAFSSLSTKIRLLHHRSRFNTLTPFFPRFCHTNHPPPRVLLNDPRFEKAIENCGVQYFQPPFNCEEDDDAIYLRYDMPGIGKEELKLWVEKGELHCLAEEVDGDPRFDKGTLQHKKYKIDLAMPLEEYRMDQLMALLKNGLLRIVIPKVNPGKGTTHPFDFEMVPSDDLEG